MNEKSRCIIYKYNVIKSLFLDGHYFRYKDFPLKYSHIDGDIVEHPISENDIVTANFAKIISIDDKGFSYRKEGNQGKKYYALFEDLDFLFEHKIE